MNLEELNNLYEFDINTGSKGYTDKNTNHSYLPLYQQLLLPIKNTAKNILEVGVMEGGSIELWSKFFTNATVYGVDIIDNVKIPLLKTNDKVKLFLNNNAYDLNFIKQNFIDNNIKFDFILDDGPHTLISMQQFIILYLPLLTDNGIFIIEDIPNINWVPILKNTIPATLHDYITIYDHRHIKNRGDDIVLVINKIPT